MEIKEALWQNCMQYVEQQRETLLIHLESNRQSLHSETKSSAGDKHETGRAMLQLEMEKVSQQLESLREMQETLNRIDPGLLHDRARLGSLVYTSNGKYYLSVSAGEVLLNGGEKYYCLSTSSPIGKLLLGKTKGECFDFRSREVVVLDVF